MPYLGGLGLGLVVADNVALTGRIGLLAEFPTMPRSTLNLGCGPAIFRLGPSLLLRFGFSSLKSSEVFVVDCRRLACFFLQKVRIICKIVVCPQRLICTLVASPPHCLVLFCALCVSLLHSLVPVPTTLSHRPVFAYLVTGLGVVVETVVLAGVS